MVHFNFAGCCLVSGCACRGCDGAGPFCDEATHADKHNYFTELPEPRSELERLERRHAHVVTELERQDIIRMKRAGEGSRAISGYLHIPRPIVREVIFETLGKGPAHTPRTRPRAEDRQRALDAGITVEEFRSERVEGGRAWTIDALNAWIAERAA